MERNDLPPRRAGISYLTQRAGSGQRTVLRHRCPPSCPPPRKPGHRLLSPAPRRRSPKRRSPSATTTPATLAAANWPRRYHQPELAVAVGRRCRSGHWRGRRVPRARVLEGAGRLPPRRHRQLPLRGHPSSRPNPAAATGERATRGTRWQAALRMPGAPATTRPRGDCCSTPPHHITAGRSPETRPAVHQSPGPPPTPDLEGLGIAAGRAAALAASLTQPDPPPAR